MGQETRTALKRQLNAERNAQVQVVSPFFHVFIDFKALVALLGVAGISPPIPAVVV